MKFGRTTSEDIENLYLVGRRSLEELDEVTAGYVRDGPVATREVCGRIQYYVGVYSKTLPPWIREPE